MSKKGKSKKNSRLCNIAIIAAIIAVLVIIFSDGLIKTLLAAVGALTVFYIVMANIEKGEK